MPQLAWVEIRCSGGFRHRRITLRSLGSAHRSALAPRGVGGYFNGGTTGFTRGAPLSMPDTTRNILATTKNVDIRRYMK